MVERANYNEAWKQIKEMNESNDFEGLQWVESACGRSQEGIVAIDHDAFPPVILFDGGWTVRSSVYLVDGSVQVDSEAGQKLRTSAASLYT